MSVSFPCDEENAVGDGGERMRRQKVEDLKIAIGVARNLAVFLTFVFEYLKIALSLLIRPLLCIYMIYTCTKL